MRLIENGNFFTQEAQKELSIIVIWIDHQEGGSQGSMYVREDLAVYQTSITAPK